MLGRAIRSRMVTSGIILLVLIAAGLALAVAFGEAPNERAFNPWSLVRLHFIANSDRPADQELKLKVRDAVLAETASIFERARTKQETKALIQENWALIQDAAERAIAKEGKDSPVRLEWGVVQFGPTEFAGLKVPSGEYEALRVLIGEAKGHNWWCILFPPMCFGETDRGIQVVPADEKGNPVVADGSTSIKWRSKLWDRFGATAYANKVRVWLQATARLGRVEGVPLTLAGQGMERGKQ